VPGMDLNFDGVLARVRPGSYQVCSGAAEVYGRFMGGSDQNAGNPGQFGQLRQFMHTAQSRINTDYFASR